MRCMPSRFPWRASASDGDNSSSDKVAVEVKKSLRNPVDTAQVNSCGSTFYASGYDEVNKEGYVLMQTLSGVAPDGREVIAVVAPGKYAPGKSVLVEARHVVDKPKDLDWERAAMLPFLVSPANKDKILCSLKSYSLSCVPGIYNNSMHAVLGRAANYCTTLLYNAVQQYSTVLL